MIGGASITWVTLAMLASSDATAPYAIGEGRLPAIITPPYEGVTGRERQRLARERARRKRKK